MTRVVCQQVEPRVGDPVGNRSLSLDAIAEAVDMGADVIVLPELVTSGYVFEGREEARAAAIRRTDPLFGRWAAEAKRGSALVIGGFCELGDDSRLYNSAAVVDSSGVVEVYRKVHLWNLEKLVFTAGSDPPPVVETAFGRIGILICYDLEFPEMTRHLALSRSQLIVVPTNWPASDKDEGERPLEAVIAIATAGANGVFIACCDRRGDERGQRWAEGTLIVDNEGRPRTPPVVGTTARADLDLTFADSKLAGGEADLFADRRPDVYARLAR